MATREQIRSVLIGKEFTAGERFVIVAQFRGAIQMSNFDEKLWELLCSADEDNLSRLQRAFPEQVAGFRSWAHGDLGERIRKAGCPI